jgi:hypothetical protein
MIQKMTKSVRSDDKRGFCILPLLLLLIALSVLAAGGTTPADTATPDDSILENPGENLFYISLVPLEL